MGFIAKVFRPSLPRDVVLYNAGILSTAKPSTTKENVLRLPVSHTQTVAKRIYPYRTKSKHWGLIILHTVRENGAETFAVDALLPNTVPDEAFEWILSHLQRIFCAQLTIHKFTPVVSGDILLFPRLVAFLNLPAMISSAPFDPHHPLLKTTCAWVGNIDKAIEHRRI